MPQHYEIYARLEPARPIEDLNRGFRAEIHDPVWFLGRQWQLGEHEGEDASSPIAVDYATSQHPIEPRPGSPDLDPMFTPAEAIVEAERETWTPGQRIRIGIVAGKALLATAKDDRSLLLTDLPPPYDRFNGRAYDGRELFRRRGELGLSPSLFIGLLPGANEDSWNYEEFSYNTSFTAANQNLSIDRHPGGRVDWFSVDVKIDPNKPRPTEILRRFNVHPASVRLIGAPQKRWWQIEDAHVDIGGFPPDRSHFPTMLLIDLIVSHSGDWFYFPIEATAGHVLTLQEVVVLDSFGDKTTLDPPSDWSMFKVNGLNSRSMIVWPTLANPLRGPHLEDVLIGIDEDSNLVWAVERRVDGSDVVTPARNTSKPSSVPGAPVTSSGKKQYDYLPSTDVYPNWHPYVIHDDDQGNRRLIQGRLADLTKSNVLMPEPRAKVLSEGNPTNPRAIHQIVPSAVPSLGLTLSRTFVLGRKTNGEPVVWIERQRTPLVFSPALHLRFDVLNERAE